MPGPLFLSWDIFCTVIDNYGDIGVSWRLARILAGRGFRVRLMVDDLDSFCRLCPEADSHLAAQHCGGVEVLHWRQPFAQIEPAEVVIEAFGCKLPQSFVEDMAKMNPQPVWINLEYLSAEKWVEEHHLLPSMHPRLPLTKYFFFPGFTPATGGLLIEDGLLEQRAGFSDEDKAAFLHSLGVPAGDEMLLSLFCYENPALPELFSSLATGEKRIRCLIPAGRIVPQVEAFFGRKLLPGECCARGNLAVTILPFLSQQKYDLLLWSMDINFVRGEDSIVRASLAGKPLIWHIYPQEDAAHHLKLEAFLQLYCRNLPADSAASLTVFWDGWNRGRLAADAWNNFLQQMGDYENNAKIWAEELSANNLVLKLVDFVKRV